MTAPAEPATTTTASPDVDLETMWHAEIPCAWGAPDRNPHWPHDAATWMLTVYPCALVHMLGDNPVHEPICQRCVDYIEAQAKAHRGNKTICLACFHIITVPDDYYSLRKL